VVLDTNLLVLFLIGRTRRGLIASHKRLAAFTERDYDALEEIVGRFQIVATTPNVLTEMSNLCDGLTGEDKNKYLAAAINHVNIVDEQYVPSRDVIASIAFSQFGLSDAVLSEIAVRHFLILTVDGSLYHFLMTLSLPVLNFNHLRTAYWAQE